MVEQLSEALRAGGCAAVICNTVKRAQEVYAALREAGIVPEQDLILFHARFPFAWREAIEQEVLARFGKQGDRSRKSVVVATHVIEQSLDLDFDLMITDLAPVDLLLQRAGRLHRHQRAARPAPLSRPRLLVTMPAEKAGVPDFGSDAYVYEPYVLLRSYLALQGREQLTLPQETEMLIEAVYGEEPPTLDSLSPELEKALADGRERMGENRLAEQHEARQRLVPEPGNRRLMNVSQGVLEEDRPEVHRALQALIRLIPPSVSVVCLHQTAAGLALEPDVNGPIVDLAQAPGPELTRELALRSVSVTHQRVVQYLLTQPEPSGWSDHPLLRTHRVAIFADGRCSLGDSGYALQLSRELGLEIHKEVA
jgi:CRISPR-associated endonuclease/helicase Cas3